MPALEGSDDAQADSRITVKAEDGRVTLSGAVDAFPERELAERDARYAIGVKAIENQLVVGLVGDAIADLDVTAAAREALNHRPDGSARGGPGERGRRLGPADG